MNRPEVQNKGPGAYKHPTTGESYKPTGTASHKGIMRVIRENKRTEAWKRQHTAHGRLSRSHGYEPVRLIGSLGYEPVIEQY